jgi:choice-of-anchor B domain-containing protein
VILARTLHEICYKAKICVQILFSSDKLASALRGFPGVPPMSPTNTLASSPHQAYALRNARSCGFARSMASNRLQRALLLLYQSALCSLALYCSVVILPQVAQAQYSCKCKSCKCGGSGACGCGCSSAKVDVAAATAQEFQPIETPVAALSAGCSGGTAAGFPCHGVNLFAHLPLGSMGGGSANLGNDISGWTSPVTGIDYALVGRTDGMRVIDLSNPANPIYLGNLPRTPGTNITPWRDMQVYDNHAYVVADFSGGTPAQRAHGMQVFNLLMLDSVDRTAAMSSPLTFTPTTTYHGFANAHNLAINEQTGYAYAVGTNTFFGGLHAVDLQNPIAPVAAGGYSGDGYNHDTSVVLYNGPDGAYSGHELSFSSNEDTLTIVDVTSKAAPLQLSRTTYPNAGYTHQGWLTSDQRYFVMNDELDERDRSDVNLTRTHVWDVSDVNAPKYLGSEPLRTAATDHDLFTDGNLVFEANYNSGLRVLDTRDIRNGELYEIGWFDIVPGTDAPGFDGAWAAFRFQSGVTVVNGINQGLFVLDTSGLAAGTPTMGVMNASFEQVERGQNPAPLALGEQVIFTGTRFPGGSSTQFDNDIQGWIGPAENSNVWHISANHMPGGASDGTNVLAIRSSLTPITVRQMLADVLAPDTLYTLSVDVGQSLLTSVNGGYDIGLYAGGTLLAHILNTDPGAPAILQGSFTTVEFTVDSRDFISLQGLPLELRLSTSRVFDVPGNGYTLFDNVSLDIQPLELDPETPAIPEPASAILLAGLLTFCRWRKPRRGHTVCKLKLELQQLEPRLTNRPRYHRDRTHAGPFLAGRDVWQLPLH